MTTYDTSSKSAQSPALWPFHVALAGFVVLAAISAVQGMGLAHYRSEDGPFETGALLGLVCALVGYCVLARSVAFGRGWHVTALLALLIAREMDFDKRFTDKGVLQARLYSGDYPLMQKLIGAAVLVLIIATLYRCVRVGTGPFLSALRQGRGWALWLGGAVALVVVAKSLDGLGRKLVPLGIELSQTTDAVAAFAEEGLEWVFALMLILAVCHWARDARLR